MPGGGSYVTQTSVITGAIRIKLPTQGSGMMMTCTVKVYEYSANKSFTITFGGHRDGANWYNEFCYIDGDKTRGDLTVRFGVSGGKDCVWIGETNSAWSYPQVFVTDFQLGYSGYSATWATGWEVAFATAFDTINRTQTAHAKITTSNIGSQSVSYATTAGSAPNAGNINQFYDVTAGAGNGLRFWNGSSAYKISMGVGALYQYGPVTDYSIKMQMNDTDPGRGFTWGRESHAPIAALNSTSGDMEIAGYFKSSEIQFNAGPYLQTYNDRNLIIKGNSSSDAGIEGRNAAGNNVFQIYGSGSNYGFLNGTWAGWDIRKTKNAAMYMNGDDSYYLQTNSTSNFYALNIQGNAVVHAGNIGSQSVSYAATSGSAGAVTGLTLTSSANNLNPDNVTQNQIGYNTSVSLFGQTDGGLYSSAYSSSWIHQIYGDFRSGQIAIRGKNSGTWQAWRVVLDSSNYTGYAPSLTGSGASGSWGISVTGSAGSVAWTNVSSRPTALSQFSNDLGNYGGFLTSLPSHTHDDRYYTESESDSRFVNADGDSMSGSLTIGTGAAYVGTHGTWTGEQNKIQWHSTHLYLQNTGGGNFFFRRADGTNLFNLDNNGSLIISGDLYPNGQGTYRLYVANSGLWTNGNFGASGDLYLGTRSTWLSSWLNQSVQTGASPSFENVYLTGIVGNNSSQTRDKLRVWDSSQYTIGMKSGYDYGHLGNNEYAMSFQMNDNSGRGFWWGDTSHSDDQGAASLTTDGRMVIATSLSIGEGESTVTPSSTTLYVKGSTDGADVLAVDGVNGRLFTITDSVLDTIYSVNTIAGLPILEVLANSTVKLGPFSAPIVINASGISTPSHGTSANWFTAFNKRPTGIGFSGSSTKTLTLTLGDGSTLTAAFNDIDTDTNTDGQTLSISGSTLTISGGNSITIPSGGISQATADGLYQPLENQRLSTSNSPTFVDIYANEWFRNNNVNEGLYNTATGAHFYSHAATGWTVTGSGGIAELAFRSNHQSTIRGYVYADTSNNIGFLTNDGNWGLQVDASKNVKIFGTDLTVGNSTSSNIYMTDTDETTRRIHCNSGRIGFLTSSNGWGAYADNSGNWFAANLSGTNTGDQTDISGNSNTTSQRVFSDLKINFPSGSGGGYSFGSSHYSMGLDSGNGAWSDPHYRDLIIGYHTGIRIGAHYSGVRFYSNSPTTDANNDGNGDGGESLLMTVGGYVGTANHTDVVVNNNLIALSSLRAPIFYDSTNTAHYVDPSGGSNIRNLYVGDTGSSWSDPGGWGTNITFSNGPHTKLVLQARTPGISAGMYVHTPGSVYIGSYSAHDVVLMRAESARMTIYSSYTYAEGYLQAADSLRAPIFYDSNDTAYYLDPNSTSELYKFSGGTLDRNDGNSLHVNSPYLTRAAQNFRHRNGTMGWGNYDLNVIASNWGSGFFDTWGSPANGPDSSGSGHYVGVQAFHYNDSNSANFHGWQMVCAQEAANRWFLRSSWNTPRAWVEMIHSGNIGSQSVSTATTAARATRANGNFYIDDNYGNTVVGVYASTRYQGVFAMGDSYKLPGDGSSTGSLYGMAWSHPNAGGVAANLNTHGLLVMENGTFLAAISGSIRARDDMRAPAIYDNGSRVAISRGEGVDYVNYSRYVYNNGAYSGTGWGEPSDLGVRYANSAGSAPNASNANTFYNVTSGEGNGLKFWSSDAYKISMGSSGLYQYGPVTDYSIKTQMNDADPGRGFTWGRTSYAPIAGLNATSGNMQIAGTFNSSNFSGSSSGTNTGDQTNVSGYARYLPNNYNGDVRTNPQSYFNYQQGLNVAMTGAWSVWSDTLWINGYSGGDVPWMCALHFLRNSEPRMAISAQTREAAAYGTYYEVITAYNIASQSVSYASTAGNTNSISNALGTAHDWTAINYFVTNNGGQAVNNSNSAKLQAYSSGNNSAFMSFHRGGHYAVNFGLDDDNVMRIGGWSAGANRWQLDMSGNMTAAGDVTAYSDARVKTNIHTIENALAKTLALRGVSYNRTDSDDVRTKIGVIAQETLEVVPEVVNQDNAGMYNVSYGNMTALLIEAIKEQQAQIEDLKLEVKKLRGE